MKKHVHKHSLFYTLSIICLALLFLFFVIVPIIFSIEYSSGMSPAEVVEKVREELTAPKVAHKETPDEVRALYMTACAAASPDFRTHILGLLEDTELNSIIIDIKDFTGTISFIREDPLDEENVGGDGCRVKDMKEFVEILHKKDVYVIGRVTVFQDPYLAQEVHPEWAVQRESDGGVWRDHKGLSFIDVGARPYWDFIIELSKESYSIGFDEINYDYIRYPSDGNLQDIAFPHSEGREKEEVLEDFFAYLDKELEETDIVTSADLFGITTTAQDDMNIGQIFERALPYFDYIAPMVYPSHYPPHFNGWVDPNDYPYELLHYVLGSAVERARATSTSLVLHADPLPRATSTDPILYPKESYPADVIRPWIQDFDYGGDYGVEEIRAQIQAAYDVGIDSYMVWDPSNQYTKEAYMPEN